MEKLIKEIESFGWHVYIDDDNAYELSRFSPFGQDFSIYVRGKNKEEFIKDLHECYNDYDPSEQAYQWLDSSGHGVNGAPHDMKDVYADMVACKAMIKELYRKLQGE